ncbi:hypothetical protein [Halodurantibacterium flavum]|uniref:Uncharacterized protein n=1 Tax=Halodurantibacterium flavum TaxID=1382802 RepID=A0ABW4S9F7_9RHOB
MPTLFTPETQQYFATRRAIMARVLIWIEALNRETGVQEALGLWNGDDHRDFVIGGQVRTYYGAGALLAVDPITSRTGLQVRLHRVVLSPLAPEVRQVIRGYDPRFAPVEIHRAVFDAETHGLVDEPHRRLKGYIDKISVSTPPKGSGARVELQIASAARALTIPVSRKRSHEALKARRDDDFRRFSAMAGTIETRWGR